jgi:Protein of unknown function (DUF4197)
MKNKFLFVLSAAALLLGPPSAQPQELVHARAQLNAARTDKITAGLKQALQLSTGKAITATGRPDGFLKNPSIKIPLPQKLHTLATGMTMMGYGSEVDALVVGMNRAAEQAVPAAKPIFLNAITSMSFDDARGLLAGNNTAATDYFKRTTSSELTTAFAPIVHQAMENVGVIRQYDKIMQSPGIPGLRAPNFNLDEYVVGKTLDGLFYMMGEEEKKIRKNPAAQTTSLLKEVFGKMSK